MLFRIITWAIVIALLYRFVMRFIFPVIHITRTTSNRLRDMQQKMDEMQHKQNSSSQSQVKDGDYIDYEEVK
jgi:hypothetical protein